MKKGIQTYWRESNSITVLYSSQQRLWDCNGSYLSLLAEDDWCSWPQIQQGARRESTILLTLLAKLLEKETNYLKTETEEKELCWMSASLLSTGTRNWLLTVNCKAYNSLAKNSREENNLWSLNMIPVSIQIKVYSFSKSRDKYPKYSMSHRIIQVLIFDL